MKLAAFFAAALACLAVSPAHAQPAEGAVVYERAFYERYGPVTALDLIQRTPGFSLDEGASVRGFAGAGGNVLIDGQRPSSKSDGLEDILARIPAADVVRIELIRGATGDLDAAGQAVVANVVLAAKSGRAPSPYRFKLEHEAGGALSVEADVSTTLTFGRATLGLGLERIDDRERGTGVERFDDPGGPDARRDEVEVEWADGWSGDANLRVDDVLGGVFRLNGQLTVAEERGFERSLRFADGATRAEVVERRSDQPVTEVEIGGDFERELTPALSVKLIGLANRDVEDSTSRLDRRRADGARSGRRSVSKETDGETIGRLEADWRRWGGHAVRAGGEVAHTFIDSEVAEFEDDGSGEVEVDVPGANTRVAELRGEAFVSDSWSPAERMTVDATLAVETSTIEQTGDVANTRSFTFAKPSLALTVAATPERQWRFRVSREVGQLNFSDFVSSSNFADEEVDLGNPELEPQRSWLARATLEQRFGEVGVVEIGVSYEAIDNLEDLLPVGGIFETPGNIGEARAWGLELLAVAPLDAVGIANGQISFDGRLLDTAVTDPVTGLDREFSNERPWRYEIEYRQDLAGSGISYGARIFGRDRERFFGLDEFEESEGRVDLDLFVERRLAGDIKLRFEADNLLDSTNRRDKTVFDGSRADGVVRFRESRERRDGPRYAVVLTGTF